MIGQKAVGILLGTKSKATVSEWLARAGLPGTSINNKKYYSIQQIKEYLTYNNKIEIREAIEILREIKIMQQLKSKGENK
jgi:Rps23 Pro-64 3,4-dihydroxylase Tpa1-like proline 4-hydroxylase